MIFEIVKCVLVGELGKEFSGINIIDGCYWRWFFCLVVVLCFYNIIFQVNFWQCFFIQRGRDEVEGVCKVESGGDVNVEIDMVVVDGVDDGVDVVFEI